MAFNSLLTKNIYEMMTVVLVSAAVAILLSEVNGMESMKLSYPQSLACKSRATSRRYQIGEDHHRYLLYASDASRQISDYYLQYVPLNIFYLIQP